MLHVEVALMCKALEIGATRPEHELAEQSAKKPTNCLMCSACSNHTLVVRVAFILWYEVGVGGKRCTVWWPQSGCECW